MKKKIFYLFILMIGISCELDYLVDVEELISDHNGNNIKIFVTGGLTTQNIHQSIRIIKPQSINSGERMDIPILGATVFVTTKNDTISFVSSSYPGVYKTSKKIKANTNYEYTLHINYLGKNYTATEKAVTTKNIELGEAPVPKLESIFYNSLMFINQKHYFGYQKPYKWLWFPLAHNEKLENYLNAYAIETYVHQGTLPQGVYSSWIVNANNNINFGSLDTDSVYAVKFTLSQNYYNFLRAYFEETDWNESEFRSTPANLPTNFSKGAAGFFYVMDHKTLKCTVKDILDFHGTEYPEEGSNTE